MKTGWGAFSTRGSFERCEYINGSEPTRTIYVPPDKCCFAVLMQSEPLAEPNVMDMFLQPSIVKICLFDYIPFLSCFSCDELEEL